MKSLCIVQARMGSTRLPGKVLKEVVGKSLIAHSLQRLKQCKNIDHIILATSTLPHDQPLLEAAKKEGVEGFAGSENDVLGRYYEAARKHKPQIVIRCTGDCPMFDPAITDLVISRHYEKGTDYTSNSVTRSYPRGMDTEVMNYSVLEQIARDAKADYEREHVTPYIYRHPELFTIQQVVAEDDLYDPDLRLCVDTPEDFELIRRIFEALYPKNPFFSVREVLELVRKNPELREINAHVEQKKI